MAELFLKDLEVYKLAHNIGKDVWNNVATWNYFDKDTLGKQIVRSADSISQNICEGYGRYHYKDKKMFFYYSRGSLYETWECLKKANERKLISDNEFIKYSETINVLGIKLNNFIKSTGNIQPKP